MNQVILEKQRTLRFKTPIILLSLASLMFTILSCITYFVNYEWEYSDGNSFYELTVGFPSFFELFYLILSIAPYILFFIYLLKFHNEFKATVLVPVIFGLIAITSLYYCIESLIYGYSFYLIDIIHHLLIIPTFALATINALKGFSKNIFLIIAIVAGLIVEFMSIINLFQAISWYLEKELYLYLFTWPISILGTITFYVSLLLFGLKKTIPAILSVSSEKENTNVEKMSPEQALRLLKDKLDLGMISEEEYQTQRAEIISKL